MHVFHSNPFGVRESMVMTTEIHDTEDRCARGADTQRPGSHIVSRALIALVALVFLAAGAVSLSRLFTGERPDTSRPAPVAVSEKPAEHPTAPPDPVFAPPSRLRIPAIGVDAPVVRVGLTPGGAMASPEGREDTGWYENGPRPGERGSAVIAGHAGYRTGHAVFDDLTEVRVGDVISVVDEDGATIEFRVRETRLYGRADSAPEVFSSEGEGTHLNLVTCTGVWDSGAGTHSQRLVVFSDAVGK